MANIHIREPLSIDLKLMRKHSAPEVHIKAAGGVRTLEDLLKVSEWGVTRIGATARAQLLKQLKEIPTSLFHRQGIKMLILIAYFLFSYSFSIISKGQLKRDA